LKILVPIKRVVDHNVKIRVKTDGSGIETANAKMSTNPFDEIAVEAAIRLREAGIATEVTVVTCGSTVCQDVLRAALAMGADRAILLETPHDIEPLAVAKLLKVVVQREAPRLVILGKQAIDDDCNQTGQMLAALLNWPQATCASRIEPGDTHAQITREIDGGLETLLLALPAIVTTDLRLNEPRYVTLPNIMKAKRIPIEVIKSAELDVDIALRLDVLHVAEPAKRPAGVMLPDVPALLERLKGAIQVA
jgi:electron transfer flavoprotein beta subunit